MLNMIKADLYRSFHRPYLYCFAVVMTALVLFVNLSFVGSSRENLLNMTLSLLIFPLMMVITFPDIVTAEESRHSTLKNTITYGTSRGRIYLSKLITSVILALVIAGVTFGIFFGSACLLMHPGKMYTQSFLLDYFYRLAIAAILYIAAIVIATVMAVLFRKSTTFVVAYAGLLIVPYLLFRLLDWRGIHIFGKFMMWTLFGQCNYLHVLPYSILYKSIIVGVIHIVIAGIVGYIIFKRQEVN